MRHRKKIYEDDRELVYEFHTGLRDDLVYFTRIDS